MKICLASMAPFVGGAEVAAERLALGLQQAGHDVFVLLGKRGAVMERMEREGLRCIHAPMFFTDKWRPVRYFLARNRLRRVLRRERPDVVHSNDLPTHQIVSDAARLLDVPRVCHHRFIYDGAVIDWLNKYGAERHLFISQAIQQELCARSATLAESSWGMVYDGIPLPPCPTNEDRRRARQELGLPQEKIIVTFTGQIIRIKGVADLLRAWSLLGAALRGRADLVIVGDDLQGQGRYRFEMQRLAGELGCPARFVGFQQDVGKWLTSSELAVVPSHVEPLGLVTLEAMGHALPVIGSAVGGIRETILPEKTGLLVPPQSPELLASAITRLLANREIRLRFGASGRQRCEQCFGLQTHVKAVLAEYERVLVPARVAATCVS